MKQQSQKDFRWSNKKLGTCNTTIGLSGCFITSLGNLLDKTPLEVNQILLEGGGYKYGCMVDSYKAAKLLGMSYEKKSPITPVEEPVIAETDYYAPKIPKHFFVLLPNKDIIDPLNPIIRKNNFSIKSIRIFKKLLVSPPTGGEQGVGKKNMTNEEFLKALYFGFFDREIDNDGKQFWLEKMNIGVPASEVVRGLLSSDEAQKHFKYVI